MIHNPVHDVIKIKYVQEGYLPNWPYHLISDKEMFEAFLGESLIEDHDHLDHTNNFLSDYYPMPDVSMRPEYDELIDEIRNHILEYLKSEGTTPVPDWVYSYMLGVVINNHSCVEDRHYLLTMIGMDNLYDEFTGPEYREIYTLSTFWIRKSLGHRVPTMFGEPHVIKALRLGEADHLY